MKYDLVGQRFGKLIVLERNNEVNNKQVIWKCQCDCGNIINRSTHNLLHSTAKIQGCPHCVSGYNDLVGQTFGALTVIKDSGKRLKRKILWECKCECGNIVYKIGSDLKHQGHHSCGCQTHLSTMLDISNQRFGHLIALNINFTYKKDHNLKTTGTAYWNCICDCGNSAVVSKSNLITGATISCGKCRVSRGEDKIASLLREHQIPFVQQKRFPECYNIRTLPFDFYVNDKYIIEFDGRQHLENVNTIWNSERTRKNDQIKNQFCFNHNIPIIRIPYSHLNNITIDDLLLQTSKFLLIKEV